MITMANCFQLTQYSCCRPLPSSPPCRSYPRAPKRLQLSPKGSCIFLFLQTASPTTWSSQHLWEGRQDLRTCARPRRPSQGRILWSQRVTCSFPAYTDWSRWDWCNWDRRCCPMVLSWRFCKYRQQKQRYPRKSALYGKWWLVVMWA